MTTDLTMPHEIPDNVQLSTQKRLRMAAITVALAGIALYAGHRWNEIRFLESTDDAYVGGNITVVSPKVSGYIKTVAVTDNQYVHAGDLLLKLDDQDYQAALEKAEANVLAQQALIANLEATLNLQNALISQAKAGVWAASAEQSRAADDAQRYKNLVERAAVSVERTQKVVTDAKQAQANEEKAKATLIAAQREIHVIEAKRQQATAALAQAIAERHLARLNLSYTELHAPIDGFVANRRAQTGAYATASNQMLAIVPANGLWVDANFKESQLEHIKPGNPVTVTADALPDHVFHGQVISVAPATGAQFSVLPPENATGNFTKIIQRIPVRIEIKNDTFAQQLRAGLSVNVEIDTRSGEKSS